jgi:hypothetical protein
VAIENKGNGSFEKCNEKVGKWNKWNENAIIKWCNESWSVSLISVVWAEWGLDDSWLWRIVVEQINAKRI